MEPKKKKVRKLNNVTTKALSALNLLQFTFMATFSLAFYFISLLTFFCSHLTLISAFAGEKNTLTWIIQAHAIGNSFFVVSDE